MSTEYKLKLHQTEVKASIINTMQTGYKNIQLLFPTLRSYLIKIYRKNVQNIYCFLGLDQILAFLETFLYGEIIHAKQVRNARYI